jgi:Chaperone of endosialidase
VATKRPHLMKNNSILILLCFVVARTGVAQSVTISPGSTNTVASSGGNHQRMVGYSEAPELTGIQAGGTATTPLATSIAARLLRLTAAGHNGTNITNPRAAIFMESANLWTATSNGTHLSFHTTEAGTTVMNERLFIRDDGKIGVNTRIPQSDFEVQGNGGISVRTYGPSFNSRLYGSSANGTVNSPSASLNDQILSRFEGHGFNGSYFEEGARVEIRAAENWASSENGSKMHFYTTPVNEDTPLRRMTIAANGRVGINTEVPDYQLEVLTTTDAGVGIKRFVNDIASAPTLVGLSVAGSEATPSATNDEYSLLLVGGRGHDGTGTTNSKARMDFVATENWDATGTGTKITFSTTENNSTTVTKRMTISNGGNVAIGGEPIAAHRLYVAGSAFKDVGGGNWDSPSDRRLKKDIQYLDSQKMLQKVLALKAATYHWIDRSKDQSLQYGFIAQELREVFPTTVKENANGYLSASYGNFDPMLVEAIKGLYELIQAQKGEISTLRAQVQSMSVSSK